MRDAPFTFLFSVYQAGQKLAYAPLIFFFVGESHRNCVYPLIPENVSASSGIASVCHIHTIHTVALKSQEIICLTYFRVYGIPLMRGRNISWEDKADALAERLAGERGYTQAKGGVSKFLDDLVLVEAGRDSAELAPEEELTDRTWRRREDDLNVGILRLPRQRINPEGVEKIEPRLIRFGGGVVIGNDKLKPIREGHSQNRSMPSRWNPETLTRKRIQGATVRREGVTVVAYPVFGVRVRGRIARFVVVRDVDSHNADFAC